MHLCTKSAQFIVISFIQGFLAFQDPLNSFTRFLLTNEVTIAQDNYMWDQVMHENKGSKDVILAYVNGVGDRGIQHNAGIHYD